MGIISINFPILHVPHIQYVCTATQKASVGTLMASACLLISESLSSVTRVFAYQILAVSNLQIECKPKLIQVIPYCPESKPPHLYDPQIIAQVFLHSI